MGILYFFCVIVWVEMEEDEEYLREELEDGFYYVVFIIILFFVVEVYVYFFCYIMIKLFINFDCFLMFNKIYISIFNLLYFLGGYKDIYRRKIFFFG